jgi:hypothetical protein
VPSEHSLAWKPRCLVHWLVGNPGKLIIGIPFFDDLLELFAKRRTSDVVLGKVVVQLLQHCKVGISRHVFNEVPCSSSSDEDRA